MINPKKATITGDFTFHKNHESQAELTTSSSVTKGGKVSFGANY